MKTKLEQYIKMKGITVTQVAKEIGTSRALVHYAINGRPVSRRTALAIERWSNGFVPAVELIGL